MVPPDHPSDLGSLEPGPVTASIAKSYKKREVYQSISISTSGPVSNAGALLLTAEVLQPIQYIAAARDAVHV